MQIKLIVNAYRSNGKTLTFAVTGEYEKRPSDMSKSEYLYVIQQQFMDEVARGKNKGYFTIGAPYSTPEDHGGITINTENIDAFIVEASYVKDGKKNKKGKKHKKDKS